MITINAPDVVFHFNKKSLQDPSVPPWILKAKGKSWYVQHVTCDLPWSTKETPDSAHTQGSIKVKKACVTIDDQNHAHITSGSMHTPESTDQIPEPILIGWTDPNIHDHVHMFAHGLIKTLDGGDCGRDWHVCEIYSDSDWTEINLALHPHVRRFMPNEWQYTEYLNPHVDSDELDED